jgi:KipI family sensor histidine kinase inhibitor
MQPSSRILVSGDTALVIEFGDRVDREANGLVLALAERIEAAAVPGIVEAVPTFRSLMLHYDPLTISHAQLKAQIAPLLEGLVATERRGRRWRFPACYHESVALDLAEVAERTGLNVSQIVARHSAATFHVYMVGFSPGFPYMGGLPPELELPRRATPRIKVPRGSVAVAMSMTAIYPMESPGGWHVLAQTPVSLWDLRRTQPVLLAPGDRVAFEPISLREHEALLSRTAAGEMHWQPEEVPEGTAA